MAELFGYAADAKLTGAATASHPETDQIETQQSFVWIVKTEVG